METPSLQIPTKLMDSIDLNRQAEELRWICDRFDPFSPPDEEIRGLLNRYLPPEEEYDPFNITNQLILLLENTLEELQSREKTH